MKLLYVGRLDKEKWIDTIIFCIKELIIHNYIFHINIYWSGQYSQELKKLSNQYPNFVTYHWWTHKKDIIWTWSESDFFLMPSTFLETFWLTACESLLCGVPVIWNRKGWLLPFIDKTLDIQQSPGVHDWEKLFNIITHIIDSNITKQNYNHLIQHVKTWYTITQREKNILPYLYNQKNILLIN